MMTSTRAVQIHLLPLEPLDSIKSLIEYSNLAIDLSRIVVFLNFFYTYLCFLFKVDDLFHIFL